MLRIKYIIAFILAVAVAGTTVAQSQCPIRFDHNEAASVGIYITEIETGKVIADYNSHRTLTPASTLKTVTAATALHLLGSQHRFETYFNFIGTDPAAGRGNLVVGCSADPTTGSREFKASASIPDSVAYALSNVGIDYIAGQLRFENDVLNDDQGVNRQWEVEDVERDYGAGLYNFNWLDNYFEPDYVMPSPELYFNELLTESLAMRDIYIDGDIMLAPADSAAVDTVRLYTHRSEPLEKIMRVMMTKSNNLFAEGVLRAMAPYATRESALQLQAKFWERHGVDLSHATIADGSGLARRNALSPRQLSAVLATMAKSNLAKTYKGLFPLAGKEGTVKNFLANSRLAGRLAIKSGTMSGVHCYAGYLLHRKTGHPTHTVVIMVNNFYCTRMQLRKAIENYLLKTLQ